MQLQDFVCHGQVGEGSFSRVEMAERKTNGRIYAIKYTRICQGSIQNITNFFNQVRVLASIHHSNIIGYKSAFYAEKLEQLCLVMEYSQFSLQKLISDYAKSQRYFEEEDIWRMAEQILRGLKVLHEMGVIHRDIKSANLLFVDDVIKICDLNSCKIVPESSIMTEIGTPLYASPEMWSGQVYSSKSDVWSFGCVVYEIASLRNPFKGSTNEQIARKIKQGTYTRIPLRYTNKLSDFVAKCLTVNPDKRADIETLLRIVANVRGTTTKTQRKPESHMPLIPQIEIPHSFAKLNKALPSPRYSPLKRCQQRRKYPKQGLFIPARETIYSRCTPLPTQVQSLQNITIPSKTLIKISRTNLNDVSPQLRTKIKSKDEKVKQCQTKKKLRTGNEQQQTYRKYKSPRAKSAKCRQKFRTVKNLLKSIK